MRNATRAHGTKRAVPPMKCPDFHLIVPLLQRIGATKWIPITFVLLERFAGLEELIDQDEDFPCNSLRTILERLPLDSADEIIAAALSRMNCFTYRAKSPISLWNPLEQSFAAFAHAHKGHVRVFQWDREHPEPNVIQAWLLEQIASHG